MHRNTELFAFLISVGRAFRYHQTLRSLLIVTIINGLTFLSFIQQMLVNISSFVLSPVLGVGEIAGDETDRNLCLDGPCIPGRRERKQINRVVQSV